MPSAGRRWHGVSEPVLETRRLHWDLRARSYDTDFAEAPIRMRVLDEIFSWLPRAGGKVLDAGTGSGRNLARLLEHVGSQAELFATDISEAMLREARTQIRANLSYVVTFVNADSFRLPFAASQFDVVISTFTLHHTPPTQQLRVLREFRRVLKQDGILALADQVEAEPLLGRDEMRKEITRVFYPHLSIEAVGQKLAPYGEWSLQPTEMKELINNAGFDAEIAQLEPIVAVIRAQLST